uniref:Diguanylate cyclase (GGDEF domain) with PAS/PAC sensor n=1 Tax=uncultured bacterium contig00002 TaxID=1181494 RepID=A0A806KN48_9BACT|nr:diguanylate cyclase (GGDEF domain) with PAS/PAC sensor [uncultured bacterium contig00002]
MSIDHALNVFFGSALVIILIFAEGIRKHSGNHVQKKLFCTMLIITFAMLTFDFIISLLSENRIREIFHGNVVFLIIDCLPFLLAICVIITFRGMFKENTFIMAVFLALFSVSLFIDIMIGSIKLIWPFIAALLLYTYFFIIQSETKIDSLTGLENRYSFNEFTSMLSHNKTGESWIIVMIDIDRFKSINDNYGHLEGDKALRDVASVIKSSLRKSDFAVRYGGDEFVLAVKAEDGVDDLMTKIINELVVLNKRNKKPYYLEISYGFDIFTADGSRPIEEFLNHIDELMYKHKEERRRAGDIKK